MTIMKVQRLKVDMTTFQRKKYGPSFSIRLRFTSIRNYNQTDQTELHGSYIVRGSHFWISQSGLLI